MVLVRVWRKLLSVPHKIKDYTTKDVYIYHWNGGWDYYCIHLLDLIVSDRSREGVCGS